MKSYSRTLLSVFLLLTTVSWAPMAYTATVSFNGTDALSSIIVNNSENKISAEIQIANADLELEFWKSVKDSDDAEMIQAYLDRYPNGEFAALAKIKLKKLKSLSSPKKYLITIDANVTSYRLFVDGESLGSVSDTREVLLTKGMHTIKVTKSGYKQFFRQINVTENDTLYLELVETRLSVTGSSTDIVSCKSSYGATSTITRESCLSSGGSVLKVISESAPSSNSSNSLSNSVDLSRYSGRYMIRGKNICIASCAAFFPLQLRISGNTVKGDFTIRNNSHDWKITYRIHKTISVSVVARRMVLALRLTEYAEGWPRDVDLTVEFSSDGKRISGNFDGSPITGNHAGEYN